MAVCLFLYLSVPKDLASRKTNVILLYRVTSYRSMKGYNYFGDCQSPKRNRPKKNITPSQCLSVYLSVLKELANAEFLRFSFTWDLFPGKVYNYFGEGTTPYQEKSPLE